MVFPGGLQGPARELLVEHLYFQSLGRKMYVPNVRSNYNLLALSLTGFCIFLSVDSGKYP